MDNVQVNGVTRSIFEVTFLQCCFERKTGRSHDEASDADLEALKYKGNDAWAVKFDDWSREAIIDIDFNIILFYYDRSTTNKSTPAKGKASTATEKKAAAVTSTSPAKPKVPAAPTEKVPAPPGSDDPVVVLEAKADLYLYDQASGLFMTQEKGAEIKVLEAGRFLCEHC